MPYPYPNAHESDVVVGQRYRVPYAVVHDDNHKHYHLPIIPNLHSDPQLNVFQEHYHVDARFKMSARAARVFGITKTGYSNTVLNMDERVPVIIFKYEKAIRETTGVIVPQPISSPNGNNNFRRFEHKYKGVKVKDQVCPHRGQRMIKCDKHDVMICPLHGLVAQIKNNKIIKRKMSYE